MLKKFHQFISEQTTTLSQEQIEFLNKYINGKYMLDSKTGLVDIQGEFRCYEEGITDFKGIKFGVVTRDFYFQGNEITSLIGSPHTVGGCFDCAVNKLTSLKGAPKIVKGYFSCTWNHGIKSLEGGPEEVGEKYDCCDVGLESIKGAPKKAKELIFYENNLITLKEIRHLVKAGDIKDININNNRFPVSVLKASLKSDKHYADAFDNAIKKGEINLNEWVHINPEWISIF